MYVSVDGISGIGKSTVLSRLLNETHFQGKKIRIVHFFSELSTFGCGGNVEPEVLRRNLHHGNISAEWREKNFRRLCIISCEAFWNIHDEWDEDVIAFDRSPLSYFSYCEGALGIQVVGTPIIHRTIEALQPIILVGNVRKARKRRFLRDKMADKGFLHNLSDDVENKVQETFVRLAFHYNLLLCNAEQALHELLNSIDRKYGQANAI